MSSSVLITGGAGFIGCRLADHLLRAGHQVTVLDVLHPQVHRAYGRPPDLPHGARLLVSDVTHEPDWRGVLALEPFQVIVHLAAETGTGQSLTEATRHGLVNVVGTTRMLDALLSAGQAPNHLVLASSRAVYGEGPWALPECPNRPIYPPPRLHADLLAGRWDPVTADGAGLQPLSSRAGVTTPNPTNIYAATKLAQEHICRAWCAATGTSLSILRLQNVYGPGQALGNAYTGIVTLFARLASGGETINIFEDGHIIRDFVFIDDVVRAFGAVIGRPPSATRTLDIGSGRKTTISEVAALITRRVNAPDPRISGDFRDGDVRAASCDIGGARTELGWEPTVDLEDGLDRLLVWIESLSRGEAVGDPR